MRISKTVGVKADRRRSALAGLLLAAAAALGGCGPVSGLETQARILSEPPCTEFFFPVYFRARSAEVTVAARRVIRNAARHTEGCGAPDVQVAGLADYRRAGDSGLALSRERARHLAEAITAAGLPEPSFQLSPLGPAGDTLPSAASPRRRADVFVRFGR